MSKRIVGISSLVYDVIGAKTFYIHPVAREMLNKGSRRATRTPTLDGGAVVYDAGYAVADRTMMIAVKTTSVLVTNWISRMVQIYNLIRISTDEGVFTAVPSRWYEENGLTWLEALLMEKET